MYFVQDPDFSSSTPSLFEPSRRGSVPTRRRVTYHPTSTRFETLDSDQPPVLRRVTHGPRLVRPTPDRFWTISHSRWTTGRQIRWRLVPRSALFVWLLSFSPGKEDAVGRSWEMTVSNCNTLFRSLFKKVPHRSSSSITSHLYLSWPLTNWQREKLPICKQIGNVKGKLVEVSTSPEKRTFSLGLGARVTPTWGTSRRTPYNDLDRELEMPRAIRSLPWVPFETIEGRAKRLRRNPLSLKTNGNHQSSL